jgi:hypothetical protein
MEDFRLTGAERQSHDLPMGWAIIAAALMLVLLVFLLAETVRLAALAQAGERA